eukprot:8587651-Heterocapsa_arctica.AAC.1
MEPFSLFTGVFGGDCGTDNRNTDTQTGCKTKTDYNRALRSTRGPQTCNSRSPRRSALPRCSALPPESSCRCARPLFLNLIVGDA